jgi:hypothetical protein
VDPPPPFTEKPRARFDLGRKRRRGSSGSQISRSSVETASRRWVKSAQRALLDPIGDRSNQNVPAHSRRARGAVEIRPSFFEFVEWETIKSCEI